VRGAPLSHIRRSVSLIKVSIATHFLGLPPPPQPLVRLLINDKLLSILDIVTFLEVEILNWRKEKKKKAIRMGQ
jgi:hypothetical protein